MPRFESRLIQRLVPASWERAVFEVATTKGISVEIRARARESYITLRGDVARVPPDQILVKVNPPPGMTDLKKFWEEVEKHGKRE